jgi:type IV pilus assembly protein PilC
LRVLEAQVESRDFRAVIQHVRVSVEGGHRLSTSLAQFPDVFDRMYVGMVKSAEHTGRIDQALEHLADHLESRAEIRQRVQAAVVYPVIVACIALILAAGIMVFLVPAFQKIYDDLGGSLPASTQALIRMSEVLRSNGPGVFGVSVLGIFLFAKLKRTERGGYIWHRLLLRMPVAGPLVGKLGVSQLASSLSHLLTAGVPILSAMELAADTTGNRVLRRLLLAARVPVGQGEPLVATLARDRAFPKILLAMLAAGERTGKTPELLASVAEYYRKEVMIALRGLTATIEPMLIATLGVLIGGMVVCVFLPIFKMHEIIGF